MQIIIKYNQKQRLQMSETKFISAFVDQNLLSDEGPHPSPEKLFQQQRQNEETIDNLNFNKTIQQNNFEEDIDEKSDSFSNAQKVNITSLIRKKIYPREQQQIPINPEQVSPDQIEIEIQDINIVLEGDDKHPLLDDKDLKIDPLNWALKIGQSEEKNSNQDIILGSLKPNDNDVYPLSIYYTGEQQKRMKIIRILVFILCFYFLVPFDLYITSHHRIYYFGTDLYNQRITFNSTSTFTFELKNCKVQLFPDTLQQSSFGLEMGFDFGTDFTLTDQKLTIAADPVQTCIVNLYLPSSLGLPLMNFNFSGIQENILIEDSNMQGLSLNFQNGLSIQGDSAFVNLNNHFISSLQINLHFSIVQLSFIQSTLKNITLLTGLYSDSINPTKTLSVKVIANQPQGNICLSSPYMFQIQNQTCPLIYAPLSVTNMTAVSCQLKTNLCIEKTNCQSNSTSSSLIFVSIKDGHIQIAYPIITNQQQFLYQKKNQITFTDASLKNLNTSAGIFIIDQANDRLVILQTIGTNYQKTWVYSNKIAFLQAQYWPLVWGSVGLLRPVSKSYKIVMIDYVCPARQSSVDLDSEVNYQYQIMYPTTHISQVAWVDGYNELYEVKSNNHGGSKYKLITMASNPMMVSAFAIAGVIALVGALFFVQLSFVLAKSLKLQYNKFLIGQKQLSITRKQNIASKEEGIVDFQNLLQEFESQATVYETRGLYNTTFTSDPDYIKRTKISFKFSLFQIPALFIDYIFRQKMNSLVEYFKVIDESKFQFTSKKMKQADKTEVSMPLYEFLQSYSNFCQKNGYVERQELETECKSTMKQFGLTIESFEGKLEPAYINLRFKTLKEKQEQIPIDTGSSIKNFLESECTFSQFETDYISFEELGVSYVTFCRISGIQESNREQIIGSEELFKFGCMIKNMNPPKRIVGIKKGLQDFISKDQTQQYSLIRRPAGLKAAILAKLVSVDGIVPNAILAVIHFVLILIVPIITPIITFLALCEMTTLQGNVFGRPVTFYDFYQTNRLDPWWKNTPHITEVAYIHIYVIFYLFFAYIEVISYYLTGYENQGKFPVQYTFIKRFFMFGFYIAIGIFLFLYVAMLWFTLVWFILAAVLNPSVFLPYTAAALTLIATFTARYLFFQTKFDNTVKSFETIVKEKIGSAFQKSLEKVKSIDRTGTIESIKVQNPSEAASNLNKDMSSLLSNENQDFDQSKASQFCDVRTMARTISKNLDGLNPIILELAISIIIQDKDSISTNIKQLGTELKMNGDLLESITMIVLCDFNQVNQLKQKSFGEAELQIKKLLRVVAPDLGIEDKFGDLCKLVLEKDPQPIIDIVSGLVLKENSLIAEQILQIFRIIGFAICRKKQKLRSELTDLTKELLEPLSFEAFELLSELRESNLFKINNDVWKFDSKINKSANLLGFDTNYPISCAIAFFANSSTISYQVLINSVKEILYYREMVTSDQKVETNKNINTSKQSESNIEKMFLAIIGVVRGEKIDVKRIAKIVSNKYPNIQAIDGDAIEILHSVSLNSVDGFEQLVYKLGCSQSKDLLMELFDIMTQKQTKVSKICCKIGVPDSISETFTELIYFLYMILTYELMMSSPEELSMKEISGMRVRIHQSLRDIRNEKEKSVNIQELSSFKVWIKRLDKSECSDPDQSIASQQSLDEDQKIELQEKLFLKQCFPSKKQTSQIHQQLWLDVIQFLSQSGLVQDYAMSIVRCSSILLLRVNNRIKQNDPAYITCIKEQYIFYETSEDRFELFIDSIGGNPLDIFKVQNKLLINYNLRDDSKIDNRENLFEPQRMNLLITNLKGSKKSLTEVCWRWYHQFNYIQSGKNTLTPHFLSQFKLNSDFIDIIQYYRYIMMSEGESNSEIDRERLEVKIQNHLREQVRATKLQNKKSQSSDFQITDKFYKQPKLIVMDIKTIEMLEKLIQLKALDKNILKKLLSSDGHKSKCIKLLKSLLLIKSDADPSQILNIVLRLSEIVPLTLNIPQNQLLEMAVTPTQRMDFISLSLLLNASKFSGICQKINTNEFNKSLRSVMDVEIGKYYQLEDKEFKVCVQALYENNFFESVSVALIKLVSDKLTDKQCYSIIGLLLGTALDDQRLQRTSILEMVKEKDMKIDVVDGLISVLFRDVEADSSIKNLCQTLEIDGKFLIDLIDLSSPFTKGLQSILIELFKSNPQKEESSICVNFLSLMKGDLTSVKALTLKLSIDQQTLIPVLAAALGNMTILSEFYSFIQENLQLTNQRSVRFIMQLLHGHSQCIKQLSSMKSDLFYIYEADLAESIFKLTYIGNRVYQKRLQDKSMIQNADSHFSTLSKKLSTIFGLQSENSLNKSMKILIKACWGDYSALASLLKRISKNAGTLWSIGADGQSKIGQIMSEKEIIDFIQSGLRQVMLKNMNIQDYVDKIQYTLFKKLKNVILPALVLKQMSQDEELKNEDTQRADMLVQAAQVDNTNNNDKLLIEAVKLFEDLNPGINTSAYLVNLSKLKDNKLKVAYKVGCTFGSSLYKRISQPYYSCITCNEELGTENLGVCQICAMFCHKGHNLVKASENLILKSLCNCGSGDFNKCSRLNIENPIYTTDKTCQLVRKIFKAIIDKSSDINKKQIKILPSSPNKELANYTTNMLVDDIQRSLDLPNFFEGIPELETELLQNQYISKQNGITLLKDILLNTSSSLAENLILLAFGDSSSSFLNILSVKKSVSAKDFLNQDPFVDRESKSSNFPLYQTISCLEALAQQDFEKFTQIGGGFASVFGEIGTREQPATERIANIMILVKGGELPDYNDEICAKKNQYCDIFKQIFGINWKSAITLHKILTLSTPQLIEVMGLNNDPDHETNSEMQNVQKWVESYLFESALGLCDRSINYCKNIIGLMSGYAPAFDFIAKERDIPLPKFKIYKTLIYLKKQHELQPVFSKLSGMIPEILSKQLLMITRGGNNILATLTFILKFLEVKAKKGKWADEISFEINENENKLKGKFLNTIFSLMAGDVSDVEKQLNFVLSRFIAKKLNVEKGEATKNIIISTFTGIYGALNQDQKLQCQLSAVFGESKLTPNILYSVFSVIRGSYSSNDINTTLKALQGEQQFIDDDQISECKQILSAMQGDLIALARITDKLKNSDTYIRSLLASLVTGQTQFDQDKVHNQEGKNLLMREIYRIFESSAVIEYSDKYPKEKLNSFIEDSFKDKVPEYLTLLLTNDKSLVEGWFNIEDLLLTSHTNNKVPSQKEIKYIKNLVEFLDPFNPEVSIKPLLKYVLKMQKGAQMDFPLFQDPFSSVVVDAKKQGSFKVDTLEFLNLIFCGLTSSDPVSSLTELIDNYFTESLNQQPSLQKVLQLTKKILLEEDFMEELPAFIGLLFKSFDLQDDNMTQIDMISQWFQVIVKMLDKQSRSVEGIRVKLKQAIQSTIDSDINDNVFASRKANINFMVDVITGLISLIKGDLQGVKPLAIKLGGFPTEIVKLDQFIKVIKQNKQGISFQSVSSLISSNTGIIQNIVDIPGGNKQLNAVAEISKNAIDDPASLMDPKVIFKHFANNRGTIGFQEFSNIFKQLGLKISHARMLQIFSAVDKEKKNELNLQQFTKSLELIKKFIISQIMDQMGLSIQDMAISFAFSIMILILMFAFIFVGISAFAPASSFSSVTHSMMPLGAGATVNKTSNSDETKQEDLSAAADNIIL